MEPADDPRPIDIVLWVVIPYLCLAVFVGWAMIWRYRYDKFGWTTRSSQLYERRLLRWGSPLFHFGILAVFFGHVDGPGRAEELDRGRRHVRGRSTTSWR